MTSDVLRAIDNLWSASRLRISFFQPTQTCKAAQMLRQTFAVLLVLQVLAGVAEASRSSAAEPWLPKNFPNPVLDPKACGRAGTLRSWCSRYFFAFLLEFLCSFYFRQRFCVALLLQDLRSG